MGHQWGTHKPLKCGELLEFGRIDLDMAVCQNLVPLVNIKIAGKWMFIPRKNGINRYWSIPIYAGWIYICIITEIWFQASLAKFGPFISSSSLSHPHLFDLFLASDHLVYHDQKAPRHCRQRARKPSPTGENLGRAPCSLSSESDESPIIWHDLDSHSTIWI